MLKYAKCIFHFLTTISLVLCSYWADIKAMLHGMIRNDDFYRNTELQCWNSVVTIRDNVATLCCAKNRRCISSRVTSHESTVDTCFCIEGTYRTCVVCFEPVNVMEK